MSHEVYASVECFYIYREKTDSIIEKPSTPHFLENEELKEKIKNDIDKVSDKIPIIINESNNTSKNILSPYMRVIYHLLKLSKENSSNKEEMKSYTNIIRSIIPYDVLMLVAINSMYFYKSPHDNKSEIKRWSDLFNDVEDPYNSFFNDYHKYYKLLSECDFFEHLIIDRKSVV